MTHTICLVAGILWLLSTLPAWSFTIDPPFWHYRDDLGREVNVSVVTLDSGDSVCLLGRRFFAQPNASCTSNSPVHDWLHQVANRNGVDHDRFSAWVPGTRFEVPYTNLMWVNYRTSELAAPRNPKVSKEKFDALSRMVTDLTNNLEALAKDVAELKMPHQHPVQRVVIDETEIARLSGILSEKFAVKGTTATAIAPVQEQLTALQQEVASLRDSPRAVGLSEEKVRQLAAGVVTKQLNQLPTALTEARVKELINARTVQTASLGDKLSNWGLGRWLLWAIAVIAIAAVGAYVAVRIIAKGFRWIKQKWHDHRNRSRNVPVRATQETPPADQETTTADLVAGMASMIEGQPSAVLGNDAYAQSRQVPFHDKAGVQREVTLHVIASAKGDRFFNPKTQNLNLIKEDTLQELYEHGYFDQSA